MSLPGAGATAKSRHILSKSHRQEWNCAGMTLVNRAAKTFRTGSVLKIGRRRWLISAQGWSVSDNPGVGTELFLTLKGFALIQTLSGFNRNFNCSPRVVADAPTLGLKLANAFGVIFELNR